MASQTEIASTYDYLDEFWRATFADIPDITAAYFNGDFSKSLLQAQLDKHAYILRCLEFTAGHRILDIGCGWGGLLRSIHVNRGHAVGWTLSPRQAGACRRAGYDVSLCDWKAVDHTQVGRFDGIACVGAFEHFCSEEEYIAGQQEDVYRAFFQRCGELLAAGSRLYLQTMLWGRAVPDPKTITVNARRNSDEYLLGLLRYFYPGSWLPADVTQIERSAAPWFSLVSTSNGRLDYIETMTRWGRAASRPTLAKLTAAVRLIPRILRERDMRYKLRAMWHGSNRECFKRRLMDHERLTLQRTSHGI